MTETALKKITKPNTDNPFFSQNGRIIIPPMRTDTMTSGRDSLAILIYKFAGVYTYSVQAHMQGRIFAKHPHPQDEVFDTIADCKRAARQALKQWADQNRLKKCFNRLVPSVTDQLDLLEEI